MKQNFTKLFLLILFLITLLPNFLSYKFVKDPVYVAGSEEYDSVLASQTTSLKLLQAYVDSSAVALNIHPGTLSYFNYYAQVVRRRFYHGYSHYTFKENYIAALAGRYIWSDLSAIVIPDDIMRYPYAACSQQSIVMMDIFKRNGIPYRKVGFIHHFAMEAKIDGNWYYFDTNKEPQFVNGIRTSLDEIIKKGQLAEIYKGSMDSAQAASIFGSPHYGAVNVYPASNAKIFHIVTGIFSHWFWIIPLLWVIKLQFFGSGKKDKNNIVTVI